MTTSTDPVVTVRGEQELFARAGHLLDANEEFLCAAVDMSTWARKEPRQAITARLRARLASTAGAYQIYKMYNPQAVANPDDELHLLKLRQAGAQVRICTTTLPHETIIVDRRVAVLAGPAVDGIRSYTVVRSPDLVLGVHTLYWSTWQSSTELTEFIRVRPPVVDEQGMEILRLLSAGYKDETAARRLTMSVRTYRRRVAELMVLLGAESRFQAGARARALGLRI